jgi:hypothetical protein
MGGDHELAAVGLPRRGGAAEAVSRWADRQKSRESDLDRRDAGAGA